MHHIKVLSGSLFKGDAVSLEVNKENRMAICRNHSTTHLLHKALKEVLGSHVAQAGSEVNTQHLRFDFSHFEAMTKEQLTEVEAKVNNAILSAMPIVVKEMPIDEAKKLGAAAQFGEKYGDTVRVVSMGDYSVEFCGGTHISNTSQAGLFKILSEGGVSAGVRRIEAVTGEGVLNYIKEKDKLILNTAEILKSNVNDIDIRAKAVTAEIKDLQKELDGFKSKLVGGMVDEVLESMEEVNGIKVISFFAGSMGMDEMADMSDKIRDKAKWPCVIVLASDKDDKASFLAVANKSAVENGIHCGNLIKEITPIVDGKGGGKPDMARGGGKDISKINEALSKVKELI
jgi:alanyl-tRNA synthetase